jgi:hypothetical protein
MRWAVALLRLDQAMFSLLGRGCWWLGYRTILPFPTGTPDTVSNSHFVSWSIFKSVPVSFAVNSLRPQFPFLFVRDGLIHGCLNPSALSGCRKRDSRGPGPCWELMEPDRIEPDPFNSAYGSRKGVEICLWSLAKCDSRRVLFLLVVIMERNPYVTYFYLERGDLPWRTGSF